MDNGNGNKWNNFQNILTLLIFEFFFPKYRQKISIRQKDLKMDIKLKVPYNGVHRNFSGSARGHLIFYSTHNYEDKLNIKLFSSAIIIIR